jgi:hypothetical protein
MPRTLTFYTPYEDVFVGSCIVATALLILATLGSRIALPRGKSADGRINS